MQLKLTIASQIPLGYTTPSFPSLYWPINPLPGAPQHLYRIFDIWRFTLFWTLLTFATVHLLASLYAVIMILRSALTTKKKPLGEKNQVRSTAVWVWVVPVGFLFVAAAEAVMAGSLVGVVIGAVYQAGGFKMSTWMPLLWGAVNVLVVILSSFSIRGGL